MFSPCRRAGVHARRTLAISKIGTLRRRRVRRDEGIPPYVSPDSRGRPGWPKTQNLFVGTGFTAPAGAFRRPTAAQRRLLGRRSRRGTLRRREGPGDDAGHRRPTEVAIPRGRGRPGWPVETRKVFVGAGFTAPAGAFRRPTAAQRRLLGRRSRPRAFAPPRGSRDDASIVPYRGCNNAGPRPSRLAQNIKFIRRGGIYPARGTPRRRRPGRYGIGPYKGDTMLCGLRFPG